MAAKKTRKSKSTPPNEDVVVDEADIPAPTSSTKKKKKKKTKTDTAAPTDSTNTKQTKKRKKQQKVVEPEPPSEESESEDDDMKLTLETLDDISDYSDEEGAMDEGEEETDADVAEATARLRQMIEDGQFDEILKNSKKKKTEKKVDVESESGEEENLQEDVLDASMNEEDEDDEEEEEETNNNDIASDDESDEEDEETSKQNTQKIALAAALEGTDRHLPWPETFAVVPPTPLPFGPVNDDVSGKKRKRNESAESDDEDDEEEYVDIHDDLKREVAFYDNAMEAVRIARSHCENAGIPFARPEDFFAEMIKSDGEYYFSFNWLCVLFFIQCS